MTANDLTAPQLRARGSVMLSAKSGPRGSVLDKLRVAGSLKAVFPRPTGQALDVVMVNTAGGITGGDHFDLQAEAAAGTTLTLTTQAAERAYRAQQGSVGRLETHLRVGADARLHWLPQETILFNGSALQRDLRVDISGGSTLLLCEPLVFGRAAMGEVLDSAYFRDTIDIRRDGKRVFLDKTLLQGDVRAQMARPHVGRGAGAVALVVYIAQDADIRLPNVRGLLPETAGASVIGTDVLVMRALASDGFELRRALMPVLEYLSNTELPKCWML